MKANCLLIVCVCIAALGVFIFIFPKTQSWRSPEGEYLIQIHYIQSACLAYRADMRSNPPLENPAFFDVLAGRNNLNKLYVQLPTSKRDAEGHVLDPWGMPYEILVKHGEITILSPGHELYSKDDKNSFDGESTQR